MRVVVVVKTVRLCKSLLNEDDYFTQWMSCCVRLDSYRPDGHAWDTSCQNVSHAPPELNAGLTLGAYLFWGARLIFLAFVEFLPDCGWIVQSHTSRHLFLFPLVATRKRVLKLGMSSCRNAQNQNAALIVVLRHSLSFTAFTFFPHHGSWNRNLPDMLNQLLSV